MEGGREGGRASFKGGARGEVAWGNKVREALLCPRISHPLPFQPGCRLCCRLVILVRVRRGCRRGALEGGGGGELAAGAACRGLSPTPHPQKCPHHAGQRG